MRIPLTQIAVALALAAAPAFALAGDLPAQLDVAYDTPPASYEQVRDGLLDQIGDADLASLAASADWRVRLEAEALAVWRDAPELAEHAWDVAPRVTRADFYRFTESDLTAPAATAVLLERFAHADEHHEIRAALVEVIARSVGDDPTLWSAPLAAALDAEASAEVRTAIAFAMRRAPSLDALPALRIAIADGDAGVRAEAARSIAWRDDGAELSGELIAALSDADAGVRAEAARAAGWRQIGAAASALSGMLADSSGDVRLNALRSLDRLGQVGRVTSLGSLTSDVDPRVARLAARLTH